MLYTIVKYIQYFFKSQNILRIHSPFVYAFYQNVLLPKNYINLEKTEKLKRYYAEGNFPLENEDYGAGSKTSYKLSSKTLVKNVASKKKYGNLLFNFVQYYKPENILELGTNLGIGTSYLASGNFHNSIVTVEGNKSISTLAKESLNKFEFKNIDFVCAKFDDVILSTLKENNAFELVFIDGNHTKEATIRYFNIISEYAKNDTVIIFDDIYWSKGMTEAWETIISNEKVRLSIDLFKFGLVFFRKENYKKEHFVLWY